MGNREDLLASAKRCLLEKGYARTTARDVATAAGTSLAAIGYHFRTTRALLDTALFEAMQEWGEELGRTLTADDEAGLPPVERFERIWARIIESFTIQRQLWVTQLEMITAAEHAPELRETLVQALTAARTGFAELFTQVDPAVDEEKARRMGSVYHALMTGVLVQWLIDPDHAPSGRDLAEGLRAVTADLGPDHRADPPAGNG